MRSARLVLASLGLVSAGTFVACQAYNMEGVTPQTIVAVETYGTFQGSKPPVLLIVQDRSGSMDACFGEEAAGPIGEGCGVDGDDNGIPDTPLKSRMDVAQLVMQDVVSRHVNDVLYGLLIYGVSAENLSCGDAVVAVPVNTDTADDVQDMYASDPRIERPVGGTPTTKALRGAYDALVDPATDALNNPDRNNFVVLITDGLMNCNKDHAFPCRCSLEAGCPGSIRLGNDLTGVAGQQKEMCLDDTDSTAEIRRLAGKGIYTFVIGLGNIATDPISVEVLNKLADAGEKPRDDPAVRFYPADNRGALQTSIDEIINSITAPCEYDLDGPVCEGRLVAINLTIDGVPVGTTCNAALEGDSWHFKENSPTKIEFSPGICTRLQSADTVTVSIRGVETDCAEDAQGAMIGPACDLTQL